MAIAGAIGSIAVSGVTAANIRIPDTGKKLIDQLIDDYRNDTIVSGNGEIIYKYDSNGRIVDSGHRRLPQNDRY